MFNVFAAVVGVGVSFKKKMRTNESCAIAGDVSHREGCFGVV